MRGEDIKIRSLGMKMLKKGEFSAQGGFSIERLDCVDEASNLIVLFFAPLESGQ